VKVWIDLANSPHVLFFAPLVREFERRGVEVVCTAREFAQTSGLARLHGLRVTTLGGHGGRSALGKARAIVGRAVRLRRFARAARPDLAVGHNSYAQAIAARTLGIPLVTLMDYEHTPANHVSFRLADRILLPGAVPAEAVVRYGATPGKVTRYPGFKEQVYLEDFEPGPGGFEGLIPDDEVARRVVVVARPPADFAIYHRFRNPLFDAWLDGAGRDPGVRVILLPRTPEQEARVRGRRLPSVIVPDRAIDGPNVMYHADLVVSAGGTMNREAAVLGVPAYSLFAGRTAAVDRALESLGRLVFVRDRDGLGAIPLRKRSEAARLRNPGLRAEIVAEILAGTGRLAA
jgi:predicted glycosyltransferase